MEPHLTRSTSRMLAPIALVVCAAAVLIVIMGSAGGDGDSPNTSAPPSESASQPSSATREPTTDTAPEKSTYTVETGDTLGAIAEETGVSVEMLQELNPALDPQALATGQKIKLVQ